MRNYVFGVLIALMAITGMVSGAWNGYDNTLTYEQNVNAIFGAKEMNLAFDPINDTANWTNNSKPINKFDAIPTVEDEQRQIETKNNIFLGKTNDPHVEQVAPNKPSRKIDASWGGSTEQEMIDEKNKEFLE